MCVYGHVTRPIHVGAITLELETMGERVGSPVLRVEIGGPGGPLRPPGPSIGPPVEPQPMSPAEAAKAIYVAGFSGGLRTGDVVLTGNDALTVHSATEVLELVEQLNSKGYHVHIETRGQYWHPEIGRIMSRRREYALDYGYNSIDLWALDRGLHPDVAPYVQAAYYVYAAGRNCTKDGLPAFTHTPDASALRPVRPHAIAGTPFDIRRVWLVPLWDADAKASLRATHGAAQTALRYGYRVALLHARIHR